MRYGTGLIIKKGYNIKSAAPVFIPIKQQKGDPPLI